MSRAVKQMQLSLLYSDGGLASFDELTTSDKIALIHPRVYLSMFNSQRKKVPVSFSKTSIRTEYSVLVSAFGVCIWSSPLFPVFLAQTVTTVNWISIITCSDNRSSFTKVIHHKWIIPVAVCLLTPSYLMESLVSQPTSHTFVLRWSLHVIYFRDASLKPPFVD